MINPGSRPLDNTDPEIAAANLEAFVDAFTERDGQLEDEPERVMPADEGGRYGWDLKRADGITVRVLMPGVPLEQIRDDLSALAPCVQVDGEWAWWNDAVGLALPLVRGPWSS